ncbi:hypothetical protein GW17_00030081 [Ensete ventricosum]|nr:hypothetical protein GW17_00030081 [Ensete ventricosum]
MGNRLYVLISTAHVMHPLRFPNSGIRAKRRQRGGGAASHSQPPSRAGHPRSGRSQGTLQGGGACGHGGLRLARRGNSRWQRDTRKGANCRVPARGCSSRLALPPAGVAASAARVVAPWQGDCQRARAATACAGATAAATHRGQGESYASIFLVYCQAYVPVIICNYMERHGRSMEVTTGPTMS